jgi:branched-chain amino acid transport system permease protein
VSPPCCGFHPLDNRNDARNDDGTRPDRHSALNSVQYGLLLFLIASGLTLIFGIMGIINLAHGSFYMIGAYLAWSLAAQLGSLWAAIPVGIVLSVGIGMVLEWLLISRLYNRDHLYQVLLTYGLILMFEETRSVIWGDDVHGVPCPLLSASIRLTETLSYPVYRLWISGVCIVLAVGMYWLIARTRLGMTIRAGASNREMVASLGINIELVYRLVFALGVALAAFAGMIAAPVSSVFPGMGNQVLIICFVVVVIGGIGSVKGALVGALLIGLVDTFGKVVEVSIGGFRVLPELAGTTTYLLMAVVLLWRPEGIFGRKLQ